MTLLSGELAFAKRKFLAKYKVNKMCQNPISGDCYFILGTLLPLSQNKPCVVAPKLLAGLCWIGARGVFVLHMGYTSGFPSPWMWWGSIVFSSLLLLPSELYDRGGEGSDQHQS